jgi:probable rRNA maturation factor
MLQNKLFKDIKMAVLGKSYVLSFSFTGPKAIQKLNLIYRNKNKPTDILSFPLSKNEGEIYICKSEAKKEAKKFDLSYEKFITYLFIHGCVHLKGYDHGVKMEAIESQLRKRFGI